MEVEKTEEEILKEQKKKARTLTIAAFVMGIVAWLILGIPLGIAGLICGIQAGRKGDQIGYIAGAFAIISGLMSWVVGMAFMFG